MDFLVDSINRKDQISIECPYCGRGVTAPFGGVTKIELNAMWETADDDEAYLTQIDIIELRMIDELFQVEGCIKCAGCGRYIRCS